MTTLFNQWKLGERAPRMSLLCLLALAAVLCQAREAAAQWVTDAQGNITTTNPGHVGIGATPDNPEGWAKVLDVYGSPHARFTIRTSTIDSRIMSHDLGWWGAPAGMFVGTRTAHPLTFGTGNTFRMIIAAGGNVGIGTTAPAQRLDVQGSLVASGSLGLGTAQPGERLDVRGNFILDAGTSPTLYTGTGGAELNRYLNLINSPLLTSASGLKAGGVLISDDYGFANPDKNDLVVKGRIGLGTAAPPARLSISDATAWPANNIGALYVNASNTIGAGLNLHASGADGRNFLLISTAGGASPGGGTFGIFDATLGTAAGYRFVLNGAGNVGIGTLAPAQRLDVAGNVNGSGLCIAGDCKTSWSQVGGSQWTTSGSSLVYNSGNVGIGTAAPENAEGWNKVLDVLGTPHARLSLRTANIDGRVMSHDSGWWGAPAGMVVGTRTAHPLSFGTAGVSRVTIDSAGNVGVGTTAPAAKLHVAGDIRIDGNINAKYQDVAEWVPSTQKLATGTVVVVDPAAVNGVLASATAYDTSVAGVVSAQPGLILGDEGEGKVKVATTGRVRVKVDATREPVRAGDLLVSGDRPGYAMKSQPLKVGNRKIHAPGTIIGKALEPLAAGTGEILVLLSLQ
jgi:hypothetical protein